MKLLCFSIRWIRSRDIPTFQGIADKISVSIIPSCEWCGRGWQPAAGVIVNHGGTFSANAAPPIGRRGIREQRVPSAVQYGLKVGRGRQLVVPIDQFRKGKIAVRRRCVGGATNAIEIGPEGKEIGVQL
mmetsp:Transcript_21174/g.20340  ORF Transcript_21174/g.20340 Transcript_21174/m.20340 type:complete len:129 (-) Transcript_21174:272-658(-)